MWMAGEVGKGDLICEHGSEEWMDAEAIAMPMREDLVEIAPSSRSVAEKTWTRPCWFIAVVMLMIGAMLTVTPFLLLGLLAIGIACVLDLPRAICGGCGNRVERTAAICPTCLAHLVAVRRKRWMILAWWLAVGASVLVAVWARV